MKLSSITSDIEHKTLIKEHFRKTNLLVEDVCKGLTAEQRSVVEGIYQELRPLIEASLTPDQVQQIFTGAEQGATSAGGNRTALGKGKDAVSKANEIINNIGKWLQNTAPVQAFDQKFEDLKTKVSAKFPDVADKLTSLGDWAKANPGKTAAVIGILTALASLAGGPAGGAIAGQVLKGGLELIKGEKLSTAVGKGMKAAAVGWLAGKSMEGIGKMISGAYEHFNPIPLDASSKYYEVNIGNGLPSTYQDATFYGSKAQYSQFKGMWGDAVAKWQSGDYAGAQAAFDQARQFAEQAGNETMNQIALNGDPAEKLAHLNQALTGLAAAAQGAATGATGMDKQGQPTQAQPTPESLSESQIRKMFYTVERKSMVLEEGIGDALKGMAGAAAGKLQQVGKNLTTKVTADKLMSAWKSAGSPTDSDAVADILRKAGVSDDIINNVYQGLNIPAPAAPAQQQGQPAAPGQQSAAAQPGQQQAAAKVTAKQIIAQLAKLDKKGKQRLMAYLQKQTGTV